MTRSSLYMLIGILTVLVVGFAAYLVYQESQRPGLEIRVDGTGISVDGRP